MRERNNHLTIRKILYLFLLPALVIVFLAGTKPVFAAQSASDALDAAFFGDDGNFDRAVAAFGDGIFFLAAAKFCGEKSAGKRRPAYNGA